MSEQTSGASRGSGPNMLVRQTLFSEIMGMVAAFWAARERNKLMLLAAALVAVIGATAYVQILLNAWNRPFYNALTHKDFSGFLQQLGVFAELAGILLVLNVAQRWLNQTSKVVLRQGLVHDLLKEWLAPMRAFRLSNSGEIGINPDQRIAADAEHLTDLMTDLGIGLLQAALLLSVFVGVLWGLSQHMTLSFAGNTFEIPGYMVWCALIYAGTASFLSWLIGRPLITLNSERYAREGELRSALVRVNEQIEGITIYGGESGERQYLNAVFETVLEVLRRIVRAATRLTWITAGYGWFTIVAPILVAAPSYFSGSMTFGELMMVVGAFNQVQSSLRWFVDNFSSIADWRATLLRVASFRQAIHIMDKLGHSTDRIRVEETEDGSIRIDDLRVAAPTGCIALSEPRVELKPGERILIVGERGAGKTLLFRAFVGLWPWGSGRITRPARQFMTFLSRRAYIPPGTLRAVVAYPHPTDAYEDASVAEALADVGLPALGTMLDKADRWDRVLNDDEKQCLAFARVILQRPRWVVLDDILDVVAPASRRRIEAVLAGKLADVGVINIGEDRTKSGLFTRTLHLVTDPNGVTFKPAAEREALSRASARS